MAKSRVIATLCGMLPLSIVLFFCWNSGAKVPVLILLTTLAIVCATMIGSAFPWLRQSGIFDSDFRDTLLKAQVRVVSSKTISKDIHDKMDFACAMGPAYISVLKDLAGNSIGHAKQARKYVWGLVVSSCLFVVSLFVFVPWSGFIVPVIASVLLLGYTVGVFIASSTREMTAQYRQLMHYEIMTDDSI